MIKSLIKVILLTIILLLPAVTWSQPGPGFPGMQRPPFMGKGPGPQGFRGEGPGLHMGRWWNHPEVQKKLELTPEQVEKLNTQRLQTDTKMIEVRANLQIAHLRLRELVNKKDASEEEIGKLIDEIGNLQKETMKTMISQTRSTQQILNEDQMGKVKKFIENRKAKAMKAPERFGKGKGKDKGKEGGMGENCPMVPGCDMKQERDRDRDRDRDGQRGEGKEQNWERRRGGPGTDGDRPGGRRGPRPDGPGPDGDRPGGPRPEGPGRRGFGMGPDGAPGMSGMMPGMMMPGMEPGMMEGGAPLPLDGPPQGELAPPPPPEGGPEMGEANEPPMEFEALSDFDAGMDEMLADFE